MEMFHMKSSDPPSSLGVSTTVKPATAAGGAGKGTVTVSGIDMLLVTP